MSVSPLPSANDANLLYALFHETFPRNDAPAPAPAAAS